MTIVNRYFVDHSDAADLCEQGYEIEDFDCYWKICYATPKELEFILGEEPRQA
jgi:hypothetical protein